MKTLIGLNGRVFCYCLKKKLKLGLLIKNAKINKTLKV